MKISPINYVKASVASMRNFVSANKYIDSIKSNVVLSEKDDTFIAAVSSLKLSDMQINETLKAQGITYCEATENTLRALAGYNGGFFSLKFNTELSPALIKESFVKAMLKGENLKLGGFLNYKNMVSHLKRQDIIQKGLKLHTYELNNKIIPTQAELAAKTLSKLSKKYIKPKDLFFVDTEAFYYDNLDKTAYSVDVTKKTFIQMKSTFRTCVFDTDESGSAVGYSTTARDIFRSKEVTTAYKEQQNISESLPPIADEVNNKLYAEAFRFGNTEINSLKKDKVSEVVNILSRKLRKNLSEEQLQYVKLYDKNKRNISRICYYDSSIGRSFVFSDQGSFLYELEYNKDPFGNIIACSKC